MPKMDIASVDFLKIIPPFMRSDPYNQALAKLLNQYAVGLSKNVQYLPIWNKVTELPLEWLEELAYEYDADFYDSSVSKEKKSELLKETLRLKAKRGTYNSTDRLLQIYLGTGFIEEWHKYGGEPYTFRIFTTNNLVDPENYKKLLAAIKYCKNARSYMGEFFYLWDMGDAQVQIQTKGKWGLWEHMYSGTYPYWYWRGNSSRHELTLGSSFKQGRWEHRFTGTFPYEYWSGKATDLDLQVETKSGGLETLYCSMDAYSEDGDLLYEDEEWMNAV